MKIWSVGELNQYIKQLISKDQNLSSFRLSGEISNFKYHAASGHCYFTLKEETSAINCVMFRGHAARLTFKPENGMSVIIGGYVSLYERSGNCQVYVEQMVKAGIGDLQKRFEDLKKKLSEEGVFKQEGERRSLPKYPQKIGLVTSQTGAVIRDMVTVMRRRYPAISLLLASASVQGKEGVSTIVAALDQLYQRDDIDLIIVARGGGSQEDLWNFNEEAVVRKIAASPIPIISAIGHETDITLSDFAADLRAGTPSIAAEQSVPDVKQLRSQVIEMQMQLGNSLSKEVKMARLRYDSLVKGSVFLKSDILFDEYRQRLDESWIKLKEQITSQIDHARQGLSHRLDTLTALNPVAVLARGFAVCENKEKHIIYRVQDVLIDDLIHLRLADGSIDACVTAIHEDHEEKING